MISSARTSWRAVLDGNGWEIVEASSFELGIAHCGGHQVVEEAIAPIKLGLCRNPDQYLETDRPGIFLAKSKLRTNGPDIIMAYSLWFRLSREQQVVELLHVEWTNPDPWGEDEPFV